MSENTTARLERETCSRCGGSGHYSYCQRFGTTCFKCSGRKEVYTKRGAAALAYLKSLRSRPASEVKVGDQIKVTGVTMSGDTFDQWMTVREIAPTAQEGASLKDGIMVPYRTELIRFEGTSKGQATAAQMRPDSPVEVLLPKEEQIATLLKAIEYQETLTKSGTPRKTRKAAGKPQAVPEAEGAKEGAKEGPKAGAWAGWGW
jgi:hypothetical protein